MVADLSRHHGPITELFKWPARTLDDWNRYRLTEEQIDFFHAYGYLAGLRLLNDEQIKILRAELADLIDPAHPGHDLFYEFHSNESTDPSTVLFHSLGAWRISPGFHDLLWNPAFLMPRRNCSVVRCASGTINSSANLLITAASWPGIRIIPTGPAPGQWLICRAGLVWMTPRLRMVACITCPAATNGIYCRLRVWRTI